MLLPVLSVLDGQEMCFLIMDNGVSIGTNGWGFPVYLISGDQMVLTGCISKVRVFL